MAHQQRREVHLIERARTGHRRAQEELWQAHRRWVAAIILAHRPRAIEVDDLMQEVAVKFIAKIKTLRDAGAFRPWLRRIVINICRGAARGQRPTLHLVDESRAAAGDSAACAVSPSAPGSSADVQVARREAARRLLEQALSLPPEYREPLMLRCVQSLTYQQISDILQLPVTTIETRLARARRMLREEVGEILTEGRA